MLNPLRQPHRTALADRMVLGCAAHGITQRELAALARLTPAHLHLIASGQVPLGPSAGRLARALGCEAGWLEHGAGTVPRWAAST